MVRQCHFCGYELSQGYSCKSCGTDLIDNGQLIDALTLWGVNQSISPKRNFIPLALFTVSGIASVGFGANWMLFVGIAAAVIYYFKMH